LAGALLGVHTPSKNPRMVSRIQAYIAYLLGRDVLRRPRSAAQAPVSVPD